MKTLAGPRLLSFAAWVLVLIGPSECQLPLAVLACDTNADASHRRHDLEGDSHHPVREQPTLGCGSESSTHLLYVTLANNTVSVIDPTTRTVTDTIKVEDHATGLALDPDTQTLYATHRGSGTVSMIKLG